MKKQSEIVGAEEGKRAKISGGLAEGGLGKGGFWSCLVTKTKENKKKHDELIVFFVCGHKKSQK